MSKGYGEALLWFIFGISLGLLVVWPLLAEDKPKDGDHYCVEYDKCTSCCGEWPGPANLCTTLAMLDCYVETVPPPKCKQWTWIENEAEFRCTIGNVE